MLMALIEAVTSTVTVTKKKPFKPSFGCYRHLCFTSEVYLFTCHCPFLEPQTAYVDSNMEQIMKLWLEIRYYIIYQIKISKS